MERHSVTRVVAFSRKLTQYLGLSLLLLGLNAPAQTPKDVTILMGSSVYQAPMFIADAEGYFKAEGVKHGSFRWFQGQKPWTLPAGRGDFLMAGDFPSVRLWSLDSEMVGIAALVSDEEVPVIVAKRELRRAADLER